MNRWQLTDLARASLQSLADCGEVVTPQDILDIQALSIEATTCKNPEVSFSRGEPVQVGTTGVYLWPLTFAAAEFYNVAEHFFRRDRARVALLAYACHFGADKERMSARSKKDVRLNLRNWVKSLHCTPAEIDDALTRVFVADVVEVEGDDVPPADLADFAADVVAELHLPPETVEYLISIDYAAEVLRRIRAAQNAIAGGREDTRSQLAGLGRLAAKMAEIKKRSKNGKPD